MGLDTTHDCWHGPYSQFGKFRDALAEAIGIDLRAMAGFAEGPGIPWETVGPDPLHALLNHSDCDGRIACHDCIPLARRLCEVAPRLGRWEGAAVRFAAGLHVAAENGDDVEFH